MPVDAPRDEARRQRQRNRPSPYDGMTLMILTNAETRDSVRKSRPQEYKKKPLTAPDVCVVCATRRFQPDIMSCRCLQPACACLYYFSQSR